jgi:PIN domain nuclease of toxin-antitoxin system
MNLLLDTCAFIWWDSGGGNLSSEGAQAMRNPANQLHLSHASIWEMQLKHQKGKLQLRRPLREIIQQQCDRNGLTLLPISPDDIYNLAYLEFQHTDPFDRIIISQAKLHNFSIVTDDPEFRKYNVPTLW